MDTCRGCGELREAWPSNKKTFVPCTISLALVVPGMLLSRWAHSYGPISYLRATIEGVGGLASLKRLWAFRRCKLSDSLSYIINTLKPRLPPPLFQGAGREGNGGLAPPKRPGRVPRSPTLVVPLGTTRGAREGEVQPWFQVLFFST